MFIVCPKVLLPFSLSCPPHPQHPNQPLVPANPPGSGSCSLSHQRNELLLGGDTSPLTGSEWGLSPDVSLGFLRCFSSVRERNANLWVAQHRLEKFCFLLLSLSPRFFPANDGHMHIWETIIYLYFLSPSLLLCSELSQQSCPKSMLREDESSLLSVPTNMKIGGVLDFSNIFLAF